MVTVVMRAWHAAVGVAVGVAVASGCGIDVRLGTALDAAVSVDGPVDASIGPFTPGTFMLTFLDPIDVSCDGTMTGNEASFSGITRATSNLVDGTVTLSPVNATVITLSGTPIMTAFGQASIDLVPNPAALPPEFPQTIWDTSVMRDFGSGPLSTLHTVRYFGIDSATASTPTSMQAAVALLYETTDTMGACFVSFGATLTSQ